MIRALSKGKANALRRARLAQPTCAESVHGGREHLERRPRDRSLREPCVGVTADPNEKSGPDEKLQRLRARRFIQSPETLRLLTSQPQTGHLEVFPADALEYVFAKTGKRKSRHGVASGGELGKARLLVANWSNQ
jgi:hypothetical protein